MIDRSQLVGGLKGVEPTRPTFKERKVERMQVCEKECVSSMIPGHETFGHTLERLRFLESLMTQC
jgi:hypothetical protein